MAPCQRSAKCMLLATAAAGALFFADQVPQLGRLRGNGEEAKVVAEQAGSAAAAPGLPAEGGRVAAQGRGDRTGAPAPAAGEGHAAAEPPGDANALGPVEDLESKAECKDLPGYNQTCIFRNVYWDPHAGFLHLHMLEGRSLPNMRLNSWGGPLAGGWPLRRDFATPEALRGFAERLAPQRRRGLTLYFQALWHHNWAHGTWDGLYPAFVALAKFGLHAERFLPFVATPFEAPSDCSDLSNMMCAMEQAFRLFGSLGDPSGELLRVHDALSAKRWILFDRLVMGSGGMGQLAAVLSLPATRDFKYLPPEQPLLPLFVSRLYRAHGLAPPARRHRSDEARPPGQKLKVVIIHNKRFGPKVVEMLRASVEACAEECPGLEVRYLNWTTLQPFSRQLELLRETDIHVSSFGTALYTSLLVPDGSVSVSLGLGDHPRHPNFPSYGEEFLSLSHQGLRTLYMPLERLRHGITVDDVVALLKQAAETIRGGFAIPVHNLEENLSIYGKIVLTLTKASEASRLGLDGWRPQQDGAPAAEDVSAELVVGRGAKFEYSADDQTRCVPHRGHMSTLVLETSPDFESCHVDVALLRALKRSYGLQEALGVTQDCECVACQACGTGR